MFSVVIKNVYIFTRQSADQSQLNGKPKLSDKTNGIPVIWKQNVRIPSLQAHLPTGPLANVRITRIHVTELIIL